MYVCMCESVLNMINMYHGALLNAFYNRNGYLQVLVSE